MHEKAKAVRVVVSIIVIIGMSYGLFVLKQRAPSLNTASTANYGQTDSANPNASGQEGDGSRLANLQTNPQSIPLSSSASTAPAPPTQTATSTEASVTTPEQVTMPQPLTSSDKRVGIVGIKVNCYNGNLTPIIEQVAKGSPAEVAGIKAGQYLVKINGTYCLPMAGLEIIQALRGTAGSTVNVTIADTERGVINGGKEQTIILTRLALNNLDNEKEKEEFVAIKPKAIAEQGSIDANKPGSVTAPFFVTSPRSPRRMIFEFIDDKTGPSKTPPAFVSYAQGDKTYDDPGAPPTIVKRFNIKEPDNLSLAGKLGVKNAPAVVFLPDNSAMIDPSQIECDPIKNNGVRVLTPSQKRAKPGRW